MVSRPDTISHYNQGCVASAAGRHAEAALHFERALALEPESLLAGYNFACALRAAGDLPRAAAAFDRCLRVHPGHADSLYNLACTLDAAGDRQGAIRAFRACVAAHPDYLEASFNLAACLQTTGDIAGAIEAWRSCAERNPDNPDPAYNLAGLLIGVGRYAEAEALLEPLSRRHPGLERISQNLSLAKWRGLLQQEVARDDPSACRILVACMPKSGSTFLADVLGRLPRMRRAHLVPDYGRREQELDLRQLINHVGLSYVSQQHVRPSKLCLELIEAFRLRPLFLYRNIWDVMASLRDHMLTHSLDWSMARIDPDFRGWDEARQYDFLARAMMPWFIDFYVSWSLVPDKLTIRYEELMAEVEPSIARIADWAGIGASAAEITQAIAETGHAATFNKGGSGRGRAVPAAARAHVEALASYYPDVDFTPLLAG